MTLKKMTHADTIVHTYLCLHKKPCMVSHDENNEHAPIIMADQLKILTRLQSKFNLIYNMYVYAFMQVENNAYFGE